MSGSRPKAPITWSSISRCCPVVTTSCSKVVGRAPIARITGAIFITSGRVPTMLSTRARRGPGAPPAARSDGKLLLRPEAVLDERLTGMLREQPALLLGPLVPGPEWAEVLAGPRTVGLIAGIDPMRAQKLGGRLFVLGVKKLEHPGEARLRILGEELVGHRQIAVGRVGAERD